MCFEFCCRFGSFRYNSIHRTEKPICGPVFLPNDRLCSLVVSVADYKHRDPGFDSRALLRIFLRELGLEWGPLSLVIG
jgi:hypothetical protein